MTDELHGVYLESVQNKGLEERKTGLRALLSRLMQTKRSVRSIVYTHTVYLHLVNYLL